MKISESRYNANRKYNEKAYDRIALTVPKGQREILKQYAESQGKSLNGFINDLINDAMRTN